MDNVTQTLSSWLDSEPRYLGEEWLAGLEERKQEEANYHDFERSGKKAEESGHVAGNARWYDAAAPVAQYIRDWIAQKAPGKVVLDYACGSGPMSLAFAKAGAKLVVGIDISEISIRSATQNAEREGVASTTRFLQRDCETTGLPDNSFDLMLCSGMLHHLNLERALPELHRLLRPGGRILCVEALNYNPAIKLYRRLTPQHRTAWEAKHILSMRDVRYARNWFAVEALRFFCMASPLATLLPAGSVRNAGMLVGHAIDKALTRIPFVQLWSWQFTFELVKHGRS